jgi:hypothetical protein
MRRSEESKEGFEGGVGEVDEPAGKSVEEPGELYSTVPVALRTTGFRLAGAPVIRDGAMSAGMETSTPT